MKLGSLSLRARVLLPIVVVFAVALGISAVALTRISRQNTIDASIASAKDTIGQYKLLRDYYTRFVIAKVNTQTNVKVSFDHKDRADTVPLPAP
jgi:hypothetical protein